MSNVFGYTCVNDVTDRTMLEEDGIWDRGKGVNTFFRLDRALQMRLME